MSMSIIPTPQATTSVAMMTLPGRCTSSTAPTAPATLKGLNGVRLGTASADATWLIDSGYELDSPS